MLKPRQIYTLVLWLLLPYVFFHLLWRARKQPEYLSHIPERFGFYKVQTDKPIIWLHTVSVGETRAASTLIKRLQVSYPDHTILLSHTTPTGRDASEQLYGDSVIRVYLPYDYPFAIQRFLQHFKPRIGVLLETEIWFNLIHQSNTLLIPLLLLNARLSEKSARSYKRFTSLTKTGLSQLNLVAAQSTEDAVRLASLGAENVTVMGNLKYDIEPPKPIHETGKHLRNLFGLNRPIFLAASTRAGEEKLLLESLNQIDLPGLLTVIVPRHPQRFEEVASLIAQHGIQFQRRSENLPVSADTKVVLGDSMGEMLAYYVACDITFIGGSLLPLGGQNLIEACAVGTPVLIGPHTYNFSQATMLAIENGAAIRIQNADNLAQTLHQLLLQPEKLAQMGKAGLSFVNANKGATEKALSKINQALYT